MSDAAGEPGRPPWPDPRATRAPMSALLLARVALELGLTEEQALAGTGLSIAALQAPDAQASTADEVQVIHNLAAAAGPAATWGLEAGQRYHLTTFGIWGFALVSAPTVRAAVDVGLRFVELSFALTAPTAEITGDGLGMVLHDPPYQPEVARFMVQRDAAAIQTIYREVLGRPVRFLRVAFTHTPAPEARATYREVFGLEPEYGAPRNLVVFDPATVDEQLPQANAHTAAMAQEQCRALLERQQARAGLAGQVRDLVVGRLRNPPSQAELATLLGMSERTLRRHLADQGTSLRALVDEVRSTLSAEFLVSGSLSVAEIAERLGYLEVSSFSQAFRRWHGMSPSAFRLAMLAV